MQNQSHFIVHTHQNYDWTNIEQKQAQKAVAWAIIMSYNYFYSSHYLQYTVFLVIL